MPMLDHKKAAVKAGEFGYVDGQNRLLCRLDVLQADFSKVTEAARNVLLIVEGTAAHPAELLRRTVEDVIADFNASRERFLKHYMPQVFAIQWHFYDSYLRTSGVHGGVASYGNFLRLLVGTELDAQGLPNVHSKR